MCVNNTFFPENSVGNMGASYAQDITITTCTSSIPEHLWTNYSPIISIMLGQMEQGTSRRSTTSSTSAFLFFMGSSNFAYISELTCTLRAVLCTLKK